MRGGGGAGAARSIWSQTHAAAHDEHVAKLTKLQPHTALFQPRDISVQARLVCCQINLRTYASTHPPYTKESRPMLAAGKEVERQNKKITLCTYTFYRHFWPICWFCLGKTLADSPRQIVVAVCQDGGRMKRLCSLQVSHGCIWCSR